MNFYHMLLGKLTIESVESHVVAQFDQFYRFIINHSL